MAKCLVKFNLRRFFLHELPSKPQLLIEVLPSTAERLAISVVLGRRCRSLPHRTFVFGNPRCEGAHTLR